MSKQTLSDIKIKITQQLQIFLVVQHLSLTSGAYLTVKLNQAWFLTLQPMPASSLTYMILIVRPWMRTLISLAMA